MRLPLLLLLGATGCAQLAGIDETSSSNPGSSTLTVEKISIGTTEIREPLDLTGLTATYLIEDPAGPGGFTRVTATAEGNTWSADLDGVIAPVLFELPIPNDPMNRKVLRLYDVPTATVTSSVAGVGRPGAEPAPVDAQLTVTVNLDTPYVDGEQLSMLTMGVWNTRGLEVPLAGSTAAGPVTFPYTSMATFTGVHERLTAQDLFFAFRHTGPLLTGYAEAPPFDQTGMDTITMQMMGVPADQPFVLNIMPMAAATRLAAARPAVGAAQFDWQVRTGPSTMFSPVRLNGGGIPTDATQINAPFGHPFAARGWQPVLTVNAFAGRAYTSPSGPSLTLLAGMFENSVAQAEQTAMFAAGFPERISINQTSLSTDNVMIPFPVAPVEIQIETDRTGNTSYAAQLFELVPNMENTQFTMKEIVGAFGVEPRFVLPPELFQAGRFYVIRAYSYVGGLDVAGGNLADFALPSSAAVVDSGVFGVMQ